MIILMDLARRLIKGATILNNANVELSIHGHQHSYSVQRDPTGIEYLVVASMEKRSYAIVTVINNNYSIEEKRF